MVTSNIKIVIPRGTNQRTFLYFSLIFSATLDIAITCDILPNSSVVRALRYIAIILPITLCITNYLTRNLRQRDKFKLEVRRAAIMIAILFVLSVIRSIGENKITIESFIQLFQIFVPFLYAYIIVNDLNEKIIISLMKALLIITAAGYLIWIAKNYGREVAFSFSILGISSPFECSDMAEVASGLSAFFIYYRKKAPISCAVAIIMNLMISKRMLILMMLVLLVCTVMKKQNEKVSNRILNCTILCFVIGIQGLYTLYQPQNIVKFVRIFGVSPEVLSVSRIYRLWYCIEQGFKSYGLASTSLFLASQNVTYLGLDFEMDLIRIMYELGIFAVAVIVYTYIKTSRNNKYCYLMMLFCLFNLLMANGIVKYLGYTYRLITIASITYSESLKYQSVERKKYDINYSSSI